MWNVFPGLEEAQAQILPYLEQIGMSQLADDHTLSVMQATVAACEYNINPFSAEIA